MPVTVKVADEDFDCSLIGLKAAFNTDSESFHCDVPGLVKYLERVSLYSLGCQSSCFGVAVELLSSALSLATFSVSVGISVFPTWSCSALS